MEKEYYTPDIEDLYIGYEYNKIALNGASLESWNSDDISESSTLTALDLINIIKWYIEDCVPLENLISVFYLTKEQIMAEGWNLEIDNGDIQTFLKGRNRLIYSYFSRILWLDDAVRGGQIAGGVKCPSINEFRKIFKLLSF